MPGLVVVERYPDLYAQALGRAVSVDVYLPGGSVADWDLLILFDGQDADRLRLTQQLLHRRQRGGHPLLVAALHANERRKYEYGIAQQADYQGRGSLAAATSDFVCQELLPMLRRNYPVAPDASRTFVAGFSLSGLMAFDLAFHHPAVFGGAGVFSGSFWWRQAPLGPDYNDDRDRIMHALVRKGQAGPSQRFWFQAGTCDETADRNSNGVIDAIDDTLDLIAALRQAGCSEAQLHYHEMEGGTHDPETWSKAFPQMLAWLTGD